MNSSSLFQRCRVAAFGVRQSISKVSGAARLSAMLFALLSATSAWADSANYIFATTTSGSLTDMSSGTTQLVAANADDTASAINNIGFDFYFQGVRYAQFSANSNGLLRLGTTAVQGAGPYQPLAQSGLPLISAYGADQRTHTSGRVHFKVEGTAPNRVLSVEWLNMQANFNTGGTADLTYQVRLSEANGAIEHVYGSMAMSTAGAASTNSNDPNIGFSSSNIVGAVGSVTAPQSGAPAPSFDAASATAFGNLYTAGNIDVLSSATDGSRRTFSYTPPAPDAAPTGLNFTATNASSTTLNWNDNSTNELGFYVYRSTDGGVTFSFVTATAANATNFVDSGLSLSTNYVYQVSAFTEGAISTTTSNAVSTTAGGSAASVASGNWSDPATWGGAVPTNDDNVTIADGHTVVIDTAAVALSVRVGAGGAPSVLIFDNTTARSLTTGASVRVSNNGSLLTDSTGTVTTHSLVVGANLINDGVLDLSTNSNTAGAGITFVGAASAVFDGIGTTTDVRSIAINKGTSNVSELELSPSNFSVRDVTTDSAGFLTLTNGTFKLSGSFSGTNRVFTLPGYTIPASTGFWLNNPNYVVAAQNGSGAVNGLFRASQGTHNVGTAAGNSLSFSANSRIIIDGGSVNTAGRFAVTSAGTIFNFSLSSGTVTTCTAGNVSTALACFDLGTSSTSTIAISGGNMVVQLASTAASGPRDFRNQAGSGIGGVTDGTLQLGNANSGVAKAYTIQGVIPKLLITNTSGNHSATFGTPATYNNISRDITISPGTTLNFGTGVFLFFGETLTNNGTIVHNGATSNFVWFTAATPVLYTGSGVVTAPMTSNSVQATLGLTIDAASAGIITNRLNLFEGGITNASKLTIGNGGVTTSAVQIGNTTTPTAAGTFDSPLTFNPGSGGTSLSVLRTTNTRVLGPELDNLSRSISRLTYDDDNPAHTLDLGGAGLTVTTTLTMTNGRIVTGSNLLDASAASIVRTSGYVDGNLARSAAAAGALTFDVGTANGYSPVIVNPTAGTFPTSIRARAVQTKSPGIAPADQALNRHWSVQATGVTANLTFSYLDPTDIPATLTEANMNAYRFDGVSYINLGGTIDTALNTGAITAQTDFGIFTLAAPGAAIGGTLVVTPTTLPFGNVTVGASSTAQSITLSNTGPVGLSVDTLTSAAAPFARTLGGSCSPTLPIIIAANGSCTLEYQFTPTAAGVVTQPLTVSAGIAGNDTITLSGTGQQGNLSLSVSTVNFGSVVVGNSSSESTVVLTNTGDASLNITALDAAATPFARTGTGSCSTTLPFSIAAGANCTLTYQFSPTAAGSASQILNVTANAPGSNTITLSGVGTAAAVGNLTITPATFSFGNHATGSTSSLGTITLGNDGSAALDVTSLTVAIAPFVRTADGTCGNSLPITISQNSSCTVTYRFAPTALGAASQTFTVGASAPGATSFALDGVGVVPVDPMFENGFE